MSIQAGTRLRSAVCSTEVIVVKAPGTDGVLTCGGAPMAEDAEAGPGAAPAPGADTGTVLGKRYVDSETPLEALCTRAGAGSLAFAGRPLTLRGAKPLPASD